MDEVSHLEGINEELRDAVKRIMTEKDQVFDYHQDLLTEMEAKNEAKV